MNCIPDRPCSLLLLLILFFGGVRVVCAAMPNKEEQASFREYVRQVEKTQARARGWRRAIKGFDRNGEVFKATYKHYGPDTPQADLRSSAQEFSAAVSELDTLCRQQGLNIDDLLGTIRALTCSDFGPVAFSTGVGRDDVKTAADYLRWGRALVSVGVRAKQAGKDPAHYWSELVDSYQHFTPESLEEWDVSERLIPPLW